MKREARMHIVNQIHNHGVRESNVLHVVGVISNPARWHSRYRLARQWQEQMRAARGVELHMVETAFGDRHHEVTGPEDLQLRTKSEAWIKESMINLGVRDLLPKDWRYVAWVDADVEFRDPNWAQETIHQLQHHAVVQPWQHCADIGSGGNILATHTSFGFMRQTGERMQKSAKEPYRNAHTGYAWACTREFWESVGGLIDFAILGSGDHHMAWAMIGDVDVSIPKVNSPSFFRRAHEWQSRATRVTNTQVGFTPGRIEHAFHGPKKRRFYQERWQILAQHGYDPDTDLIHDSQGLVQLVGKPGLEHAIGQYNRARSEDSVDE